ncbi:MAG: hypothetical protein KUG53_04370 [Pseudomonadales bacterium]|nr:hypothetical protein [Pseudomonadales bacterium]
MSAISLSICLAVSGNIIAGHAFAQLLTHHGSPVSLSLGRRIFLLSQITKYIPGKIWSYLMQMTHLPPGAKIQSMLRANIDLMILSIWRNIVIGVSLLIFISGSTLLSFIVVTIGFTASMIVISGVHWKIVTACLPGITEGDQGSIKITVNHRVTLEIWSSGLLTIIGQYIFLRYGIFIDESLTLTLIAINLLSWVISTALFIFPAGIGVREWVFIQTAQLTGIASSIAAPITLFIRFWQISVDVVGGVLALILRDRIETLTQSE